jgi:glycosyltransferase involved in cell wall biosynthesis
MIKGMPQKFFSFILPAYNEERLIEKTLAHLEQLDYPKDRYEVIVVENGSSDATVELAKRHESANVHVYSSEKGVSRARNLGMTKVSQEAEWIIFMDADVFILPRLLAELNGHLAKHPSAGYGTVDVRLATDRLAGRVWAAVNSFFFRLTKFMYTVHIVKREYAERVKYDENLVSGEDVVYGRALAKAGARFFYMRTRQVYASDRRFKKKGYLNMFIINAYSGIRMFILPKHKLEKVEWEPIR